VDIGGTLTSSPTSAASDYTLSVPFPVALTTYTNPTIVGELWLSVVNGTNSNTFKAYARTLTAGNASNVALRLLTGTADEAFGALTSGSAFTLQGTVKYTTTSANSSIGVPTSYIAANFRQDVNGNVGLNTGSSNIRAKFDVIQSSNIPALVVDQYGTGDALQVMDGGVTQLVVDGSGNVGIGTATPESALHISSTGPANLIIDADTDNITEADSAGIILRQDAKISQGVVKLQNTGNNHLIIGVSSTTSPDIYFTTSNISGIQVDIDSTVSSKMVIQNNGNVGIGTTNPQAKLHVNGDAIISGNMLTPARHAFFARKTNGSTSDPAISAILFNDVVVNEGSRYNPANGRFTAGVAGLYSFAFTICGAISSFANAVLELNALPVAQVFSNSGGNASSASVSVVLKLAVNDYVSVRAYNAYIGNNHTFFSGFFIG
jgi:hypothetical protein